MQPNEEKQVERIRRSYTENEPTKYEQLKQLDAKVKRPADIFAYTFGILAALILGTGMCLAMEVIASGTAAMIAGIAVGIVGIALAVANYFIYKLILKKRRARYGERVLALSDEILNG